MPQKKPQDSRNIIPAFTIENAAKAIEFYKTVLGAKQKFLMNMPDGKVGHAELVIGDSAFMIGEACDEAKMFATNNNTFVYVDDVDAVFKKAIENGAEEMMPVADQFWGDRVGGFRDPFGQIWSIGTHIEDVSEDEMKRRGAQFYKEHAKKAA